MRPLYHPAIKDITVQSILHALSDPVRVHIYMDLARSECTKNCTTFHSINDMQLPKSTLSQHFKILREAGLIFSERKGVEMHNRTRCDELRPIYGNMIKGIIEAYIRQMQG